MNEYHSTFIIFLSLNLFISLEICENFYWTILICIMQSQNKISIIFGFIANI